MAFDIWQCFWVNQKVASNHLFVRVPELQIVNLRLANLSKDECRGVSSQFVHLFHSEFMVSYLFLTFKNASNQTFCEWKCANRMVESFSRSIVRVNQRVATVEEFGDVASQVPKKVEFAARVHFFESLHFQNQVVENHQLFSCFDLLVNIFTWKSLNLNIFVIGAGLADLWSFNNSLIFLVDASVGYFCDNDYNHKGPKTGNTEQEGEVVF